MEPVSDLLEMGLETLVLDSVTNSLLVQSMIVVAYQLRCLKMFSISISLSIELQKC